MLFTQFSSRELQLDCRQEIPVLLYICRDDHRASSYMLNIDASETCNRLWIALVCRDNFPPLASSIASHDISC